MNTFGDKLLTKDEDGRDTLKQKAANQMKHATNQEELHEVELPLYNGQSNNNEDGLNNPYPLQRKTSKIAIEDEQIFQELKDTKKPREFE